MSALKDLTPENARRDAEFVSRGGIRALPMDYPEYSVALSEEEACAWEATGKWKRAASEKHS